MSTPAIFLRLRPLFILGMIAGFSLPVGAAAPLEKPNVVVILVDDLGWTDLGVYGSDLYETPHIDRLAQDGMRFTQAYSACTVCSPSRAALLSGQYPARIKVTDWIPGRLPQNPKLLIPDWSKQLPLETVTLAERLREADYISASIGKWHLGQERFYPEKHGFDLNVAGTREGNPTPGGYIAPYRIPTLREGPEGEYLTDRMAEEAVRFVDANKHQPFLLYLPHFAVHTPLQAKAELVTKYEKKVTPAMRHRNAKYAAMIESLDDAVGRVREALAHAGIAERTIIIFGSDNGGYLRATSNAPLRVGKGSGYEGGVRVPFIVYWPNVTQAGAVSDAITITPDIYATVLAAAGLKENRPDADGVDLRPVLSGTGRLDREAIYWHYPHYQLYHEHGTTPYGAIREGDFKLIEYYDDMRVELYNLRDDIGETRDLARSRADVAARLRARLHHWRHLVGAQMPSPNPNYDPSKPEQFAGPTPRKEAF